MTIAAVDVDYRPDHAVAACVLFDAWTDAAPSSEHSARVDDVAPYEPGAFYKRELPCILAVLRALDAPVACVVVDGYVNLGDKPGLGEHLYDALAKKAVVVGVAKSEFRAARAVEVVRGASAQPLYVTAVGVDVNEAAAWVRAMHGANRIPTLLGRVDAVARRA